MLLHPVLELSRRTMLSLHSKANQKYRYLMLLLWKTNIVGTDEIFLSKCCLSPVEFWKGRYIFNFFSRFKWNVIFSLWTCHNISCSDILNDISFFICPIDWGSETVKSFQSQGKILDKGRCPRHQGCFPRQGRIQDFFRRGCTRLLLYFNTNKPHSFFLQNTSFVRKPQVISGGGGRECAPPAPSP